MTICCMSSIVTMHTLHILSELKLSVKPPIAWAPRLSEEKGPILPLNTRSTPSTLIVTPLSCKLYIT